MEIQKVKEIAEIIEKTELNPNEYFLLYYLFTGKEVPKSINYDYKYSLRKHSYLDEYDNLSVKAKKLFGQNLVDLDNVEKYRLLWPSLILPSGKNARSSAKELEVRFKWFFENYDYSWEEIFSATEEYIRYFEKKGYTFMRTSAYFIYKEASPKLRSSTLAEWCDKISDGGVHEDTYDLDI